MSTKLYITDAEFEKLNWHNQRNYLYCQECGMFYNKDELGHNCNHGIDEGHKNGGFKHGI